MRSLFPILSPPWVVLSLLALTLLALVSCEEEVAGGSTTSGRRIILKTRLEVTAPGDPFLTGLGWKVTLTKAAVATGPLYYFDGAPPFAAAPRQLRRGVLARWLGPSVAWAHPGHYVPGNARGQVLQSWSADLLAGTTELPAGDGITGVYRSGRFSFAASSAGPAAGFLGSNVAAVEGRAEKDGMTVYFRVGTDLATLTTRAPEGRVDGCVFEEVDVQQDGTVVVQIRPSVWFNLVDFSGVAPGTVAAPTTIQPGENAHLGFLVGLAQLSAYRFRYEP
ncbi:MAG: hypothetical protein RMJ98_16035 [Myxococcales bacterium]|nr:hypothetical protein [Polyangiaceae bacterium]MDW8250807.1 hypothetical protein [Myxococcales bacterium]